MTATHSPTTEPTAPAESGREDLVWVDPADLLLGANVRGDTRPDAKDFAASIKARGVLEAITAYRNDDGHLVVLRGQRRALVAATVGTPTGTVPVRVVAAPTEPDRIVDQLSENLHRAPMHDAEVLAGVEQLALVGVSPAQIAKRTALTRVTVDAALAVARSEPTRRRVVDDGLTLETAAVFAEFEHDPAALDRLEQAARWGRPLDHVAQQLRDEAAERAEIVAECARLREQGLPVLDPDDVPASTHYLRLADLRTESGDPVPPEDWPRVPGAAVMVAKEWRDPARTDGEPGESPDDDPDDTDDDCADEYDDEAGEAVEVLTTVWICLDPKAAGLHHRWETHLSTNASAPGAETGPSGQADREAQREQRRTVIANNKAWDSAETVRRQWLAGFLTRKSPPAGAEALVCEALLTGHHSLDRAMHAHHPRLRDLLPHAVTSGDSNAANYTAGRDVCARLVAKATTPKAATMLALAAVLAAWEDTTGRHTWRNPTPWDARVMAALQDWGYQPSDVELLLTQNGPQDLTSSLTTEATNDSAPADPNPAPATPDDAA